VQHELMPRVSVDIGYYRTSFGNFVVTDNRALSPADFDQFSITAPSDSRLPGGGGYPVTGLFNVKPERFSVPADNFITYAKKYGDQSRLWEGVDMSVNARLRTDLMLQAGTSTGHTRTNNCQVVERLPEMLQAPLALGEPNVLGVAALSANVWTPASLCEQQTKFLTNFKFLGVYTVPRIDVQVSGTMQSYPGPQIIANFVATNQVVSPGLGRNLSGTAQNMTVNIVTPGTLYGERSNQVGLRLAKILRLSGVRTTASVDFYNLFNADAILTLNNNFATWQRPQSIINPRWAKVVLQFDF
jgi:hypothetical protein